MTNPAGQKLLKSYRLYQQHRGCEMPAGGHPGKELLGNFHPARTVAEQERPWREQCHQAADSDPEAPLSSSLVFCTGGQLQYGSRKDAVLEEINPGSQNQNNRRRGAWHLAANPRSLNGVAKGIVWEATGLPDSIVRTKRKSTVLLVYYVLHRCAARDRAVRWIFQAPGRAHTRRSQVCLHSLSRALSALAWSRQGSLSVSTQAFLLGARGFFDAVL